MADAVGGPEPDYARTCQAIVPGLYFGPLGSAQDRTQLAAHGITHVVTVMAGPSNLFPDLCTYLHMGTCKLDAGGSKPSWTERCPWGDVVALTPFVPLHCRTQSM